MLWDSGLVNHYLSTECFSYYKTREGQCECLGLDMSTVKLSQSLGWWIGFLSHSGKLPQNQWLPLIAPEMIHLKSPLLTESRVHRTLIPLDRNPEPHGVSSKGHTTVTTEGSITCWQGHLGLCNRLHIAHIATKTLKHISSTVPHHYTTHNLSICYLLQHLVTASDP